MRLNYLFIPAFLFFLPGCSDTTAEAEAQRIADSFRRDDSVKTVIVFAKEKATADSLAIVNNQKFAQCPELKEYFGMSNRIVNLMNSNDDITTLEKKFKTLSDSLLLMETHIMGHGFVGMDSVCKKMFLDRMSNNATELSEGLQKKMRGG